MMQKRFRNASQGTLVKPITHIKALKSQFDRDDTFDLYVTLKGLRINFTWTS